LVHPGVISVASTLESNSRAEIVATATADGQREKAMIEVAMPAFAKSDSSRKHNDLHRPSTEGADFKRELDRRLDQALEDTFPASDPVSIVMSVGYEQALRSS
jgi:hypothetical protein